MLKSLKIENFRCFPFFEMKRLGRINLLVGKNNSGKTSILEAIQLLYSPDDLEKFGFFMGERGEYCFDSEQVELDIRYAFCGRDIDIGSQFSLLGMNLDDSHKEVSFSICLQENISPESIENQEFQLIVKWEDNNTQSQKNIPLSSNLGLATSYLQPRINLSKDKKKNQVLTQFITSSLSSFLTHKIISLFDQIVLTPEEELVIQVLKTIEPDIERIASISGITELTKTGIRYTTIRSFRSSFIIKLANSDQRIPIGSMGDGIWRILGLTLAIINAKNGVLLVDEIDTGLHFSAMSDMWKLLYETAKRLNVQVFATTHSRDCWESLAEIAEAKDSSENDITIHRIEKGRASSIVIGEDEMAIAAERGIEVR